MADFLDYRFIDVEDLFLKSYKKSFVEYFKENNKDCIESLISLLVMTSKMIDLNGEDVVFSMIRGYRPNNTLSTLMKQLGKVLYVENKDWMNNIDDPQKYYVLCSFTNECIKKEAGKYLEPTLDEYYRKSADLVISK